MHVTYCYIIIVLHWRYRQDWVTSGRAEISSYAECQRKESSDSNVGCLSLSNIFVFRHLFLAPLYPFVLGSLLPLDKIFVISRCSAIVLVLLLTWCSAAMPPAVCLEPEGLISSSSIHMFLAYGEVLIEDQSFFPFCQGMSIPSNLARFCSFFKAVCHSLFFFFFLCPVPLLFLGINEANFPNWDFHKSLTLEGPLSNLTQ